MNMRIASVPDGAEITVAGDSVALVNYEARERQLDTFVRDGSGAPVRLFLTTVVRTGTREVVAHQISARPLDHQRLSELAFAYGGVFLPLGEADRWAIALPKTCEAF